MDHLPLWKGSDVPPLKVPLLCDLSDLEDVNFNEYPDQHGFDYQELLQRASSLGELEWSARHVQVWLYFGLIQQVSRILSIPVDLSQFIEHQDGQSYIMSESLPRLMTQLVLAKVPHHCDLKTSNTHSFAYWHGVSIKIPYPDGCIEKTHSVVSAFTLRITALRTKSPVPRTMTSLELVLLSVAILGECLEVYRATGDWSGPKPSLQWPLPDFLAELLVSRGWCPFEILTTYHRYPSHGYRCYLLCVLYGYSRSGLLYNHTRCSAEACKAFDMDWKKYTPIHVDGPQSPQDPAISSHTCVVPECKQLTVGNYDLVVKAIEDGQTVLITISTSTDNKKTVHLESSRRSRSPIKHMQQISTRMSSSSSGTRLSPHHDKWTALAPYVAISHVWSDGLGNPNENCLPACRLSQLQEMVNELYPELTGNVPFWIDTICVPRKDQHLRARQKAIHSMHRIYAEADKVLVVDASIMKAPVDACLEQRVLTITSSPWTQRLWTYQEGVLASSLWFRFATKSISYAALKAERIELQSGDVEQLHNELQRRVSSARRLKNDMSCKFNNLHDNDRTSAEWIRPILHMWPIGYLVGDVEERHPLGRDLRKLSWCFKDRHTSNRFDEPLCLAILLQPTLLPQFDAQDDQAKENRMKLLFSSFQEVSHEMLWWPTERYEEDGYRWIPRTLFTGSVAMPFVLSNLSARHVPSVRVHVIPNGGGLSIKQRDPALSFLYLHPFQFTTRPAAGPSTLPDDSTDRIVICSGTDDHREYHAVTICEGNRRKSWSTLQNEKIALIILTEKPTFVDLAHYGPTRKPPAELLPSSSRAAVVSYSGEPQRCGGVFRFEASVRDMGRIDTPGVGDRVIGAWRYQTTDDDCCYLASGRHDHRRNFKPPNWILR